MTRRPHDPRPVRHRLGRGGLLGPVLGAVLAGCADAPPLAQCTDGTAWSPGTTLYAEATAAWGLDALGATGTRLSTVDYDGDGWPDLVVRAVGSTGDGPEGRTTWLLRNTGQGTFEDVTEASGLWQTREGAEGRGRPGSLVAFGDLDNDGDLDAVVAVADLGAADPAGEGHEVMLNDGDGTFSLGPRNHDWTQGVLTAASGLALTDMDRDGFLDLWATSFGDQDRLLRGNGTGRLGDVTDDRGLTTERWTSVEVINAAEAHSRAWSATACDLDRDGTPELLAASYGRAPNQLWAGDGSGPEPTWVNESWASGYAADDDEDWTDNESARCWCSLHPGDADCDLVTEPPAIPCSSDGDAFRWNHATDREPYRLGGNSGTTVCAEIDGDGHPDLLTTEIVHWDVGGSSDPSTVLFGDGTRALERPGNDATGLTRERDIPFDDGDITGAVFDADGDGLKDVLIGSTDYPGTRALLYRQDAPRSFTAVPPRQGIDHLRSHGVAVADFDRDGDLDVVLGHSRNRCGGECYDEGHVRLYENQLAQDGNWLQIRLEGTTANRSAIGAVVEVDTGDRVQTFTVDGGHGHYGLQHDLLVHAGLGGACRADVTVTWPDADRSTETLTLTSGHRFRWVQGEGGVEVVE